MNGGRKPTLPLDRAQVIDKISAVYDIIEDYVGDLYTDKEEVLRNAMQTLSCPLISTSFGVPVGAKKAPDLQIKVEPRSKLILIATGSRKVRELINPILRAMPK